MTNGMALLIIGILYLSGYPDRKRDDGSKRFNQMLLCVSVILVVDLLGWWLEGQCFPGSLALQIAANTLLWAGQIVCTFLWFLYARQWLDPNAHQQISPLLYLPLATFGLILLCNIFTGWIFFFNAEHLYRRGSLYLLLTLLFGGYSDVAFVMTLRRYLTARDKETKFSCLWMSSFMLLPYLAMLAQMCVYGFSLITPAYALSFLMIYLNVHQQRMVAEQMTVLRQEAELQKASIAIMLSQIQPHFLYNSLCVIQDLCNGKAPEAEQATIAFSRFLRGNLDSLKADKPIAFKQELTHTRYYLTLEQLRFGERLRVAYNIQSELFRLPALSLQPIVENAVRYGVMKRPEGGTVTISSQETNTHYVITVEDNGVGFDPLEKHADGRTHIGISNVRQRLQDMCAGSLLLESTPRQGTLATILLPKERAEGERT